MVRLTALNPGVAVVGSFSTGAQTGVMASMYLYGADAAAVADSEQARWETWMAETVPVAGPER